MLNTFQNLRASIDAASARGVDDKSCTLWRGFANAYEATRDFKSAAALTNAVDQTEGSDGTTAAGNSDGGVGAFIVSGHVTDDAGKNLQDAGSAIGTVVHDTVGAAVEAAVPGLDNVRWYVLAGGGLAALLALAIIISNVRQLVR